MKHYIAMRYNGNGAKRYRQAEGWGNFNFQMALCGRE